MMMTSRGFARRQEELLVAKRGMLELFVQLCVSSDYNKR